MSSIPPLHELSGAFGFTVPQSLHRLLQLAEAQNAGSPDTSLRALGLSGLFSETEWNTAYNRLEGGYYTSYYFHPPELFTFAQGRHSFGMPTGFYVDAPAECVGDELPVATFCFQEYGLNFEGASLPGFLLARLHAFLESLAEEGFMPSGGEAEEDMEGLKTLMPLLNGYFDFGLPFDSEAPWDEESSRLFDEVDARMASGDRTHRHFTYPTHDGVGVVVPESTIDQRFLDGLSWPKLKPHGMEGIELEKSGFQYDPELCEIARERLPAEPGTALVIARNLRVLNFGTQRQARYRQMVEETQLVMAEAYVALNRHFLAERLRAQDAALIGLLDGSE